MHMTTSTLLCFLGASMALTVAPGPDNLFVLTQGITRGRKPAIITALGMCCGISVHTTAAAFGISALLYSSLLAFVIVKYAGAAYLLYLAWKTLAKPTTPALVPAQKQPATQLLRRGFIMNVLNPKVALFFLAFLPQFVTPKTGNITLQMLLLGSIFMLQAVVIFSLIGWFSGYIGSCLLAKPAAARKFDWLTAFVLASLGVRMALAER